MVLSARTARSASPLTEHNTAARRLLDDASLVWPGARTALLDVAVVADRKDPYVVSDLRLAVNQPENRAGDQKNDPGANFAAQGYAGHYCSVPREVDPGIVACSFIVSGERFFNVQDPAHPYEVGYFNKPVAPGVKPGHEGSWAMSAPAWDLKHRMVWYTDGNSGFYAVRLAPSIVPSSY